DQAGGTTFVISLDPGASDIRLRDFVIDPHWPKSRSPGSRPKSSAWRPGAAAPPRASTRCWPGRSTTVINAYLGPIMDFYIHGVAERLWTLGVTAMPYLTQSNGG